MSDKIAIKVEDLTIAYNHTPVLWDIDLTVQKGVLMAIVGPNGAGKSTLIKSMLGFLTPVSGNVLFFGKPYSAVRKRIAYVPQKGSVDWDFPTDVFDVVMMGRYGELGILKRPKKEDFDKVEQALEEVGMLSFAHRQISQLSGGQQQRVFLARALVQNVDAKTEKSIVSVLQRLRDLGKTVIVVHHDLQTVKSYFDEVTLLNIKVVASGPVQEVFTENNIKQTYRIVSQKEAEL